MTTGGRLVEIRIAFLHNALNTKHRIAKGSYIGSELLRHFTSAVNLTVHDYQHAFTASLRRPRRLHRLQ